MKTIFRMLEEEKISSVSQKISGKVLNLGSAGAYSDIFGPDCIVSTADLYQKADIILDANKKFPIKEKTYDCVFAINLIEHLFNPKNMVFESYRILKKGGKLIFSAPFLFPYHPSPNDCFRFCKDGLEYMLSDAGFSKIEIMEMGGRFSFLLDQFRQERITYAVFGIFIPLARFLDERLLTPIERKKGKRYHFGYFVVAEK